MKERLSDVEQDLLLREFKRTRDPRVRAKLILHNQKLAVWHARRINGYERHAADLEQAATIGIIRAVDGFDPDKGFKFSTYASMWCRSEIQEFFRKNTVMPLSKQDSQKVNSEFAAGTLSERSQFLNDIRNTLTIDMPVEFGGNRIQAEVAISDDHGEDQATYTSILKELMPRLTPESQVIVTGKLNGQQISGIAKDIGRSAEYTRQKYKAALLQLQDLADVLGIDNPFKI